MIQDFEFVFFELLPFCQWKQAVVVPPNPSTQGLFFSFHPHRENGFL